MNPLGFFTAPFPETDLSEVLDLARRWRVDALEIGCGGYPGTHHADARHLMNAPEEIETFRQQLDDAGIRHRVLSCHCNPLHPDSIQADLADQTLRQTLHLAHRLGIRTVVTFSGVGGQGGQFNWPVLGWPTDYSHYWTEVWETQLIPYWQGIAALAESLDVRIAIEPHGGFLVHSPGTLLMLREACGPSIGVNLDPSHFWWQGLDPLAGVRLLGDALHHVHIKDWLADEREQALWGMLDPRPRTPDITPAWEFAIPGRGHDEGFWQAFIAACIATGYDGMFSIEHEDPTLDPVTGIERSLDFIRALTV
ncbi:sugar phosphate isomerase/epimerase family protein [Saccharospirillum salsuginis]|uniref:Xylose isomerase n=1 Tax=Saccharospirillum salsuginis TaxID=418750 RepID=A0A918N637_9GAMM|nr:sugar phosphate isomerase/epimerase [Saccharospirillum salsuginis]GGX38119.1 xylose isomerase [Saccharospirillum salsuginis]